MKKGLNKLTHINAAEFGRDYNSRGRINGRYAEHPYLRSDFLEKNPELIPIAEKIRGN